MAHKTRAISRPLSSSHSNHSDHNSSHSPSRSRSSPAINSDKENETSRTKRTMADTEADARRVKRRRTDGHGTDGQQRQSSAEPAEMDSGIGGIDTQTQTNLKSVRFYDPEQDEAERRKLKVKGRNLERDIINNRDQYIQANSGGITEAVRKANRIFKDVKQTSEATLDGRMLVTLSDLAQKRASRLVLGDTTNGIDIDDFVSKCITFMRQSEPQPSSSRRRRTQSDDDEDDDDADQILDWASLGSQICIPSNLRPAVPGFLLGPLSVQKKVRAATQRRARLNTQAGTETRPENLSMNDMQTTNDNSVRVVCAKIKSRLVDHCSKAAEAVEASVDDMSTEEQIAHAMKDQRITNTGGPGLFDFVINPDDFGQTVENLFYVSFLIKEGEVGIEEDQNGLPTLSPNQETVQGARERKATRHQAVFGLDFKTWKDLVEAFDIRDPLIPSRASEASRTQIGRNGWYG